jgi:hypothetical protein
MVMDKPWSWINPYMDGFLQNLPPASKVPHLGQLYTALSLRL